MSYFDFLKKITNISHEWKLDQFTKLKNIDIKSDREILLYLDKRTGKNVVIKKMKRDRFRSRSDFKNEIIHHAILSNCSNICKLLGVMLSTTSIYMIIDHCGEDLFNYISDNFIKISEERKIKWFYQLLNGIKCCHDREIAHLDIKLENCLLSKDDNISIIDFEFSKHISQITPNMYGTHEYMSPEMIESRIISKKTDSWACGVFLYILLIFKFPFLSGDINNILKNIKSKSDFSEIPSKFQPIILGLLDQNDETRWTIDQALEFVKILYPNLIDSTKIETDSTKIETDLDNTSKLPTPLEKGYTIYGHNDCPFCRKAKEWFYKNGSTFMFILVDDFFTDRSDLYKDPIISKYNQTTVPVIFKDNNFIGGWDEFMETSDYHVLD